MTKTPVKAIAANCRDCCEGFKAIAYCPCDGVHSTYCEFWPYRFGKKPEAAKREFGKAMLTPELMPGAHVDLDELPRNPRDYRPEDFVCEVS